MKFTPPFLAFTLYLLCNEPSNPYCRWPSGPEDFGPCRKARLNQAEISSSISFDMLRLAQRQPVNLTRSEYRGWPPRDLRRGAAQCIRGCCHGNWLVSAAGGPNKPPPTSVSCRDNQRAVWLCFRFPLSYRDVEDLLAERAFLRDDTALGFMGRDNHALDQRPVAP